MKRTELIKALESVVGKANVITDRAALMLYEADGCVMETHAPDVVILPATHEEVKRAIQLAREAQVPVVARGSGTGLSGGSTPVFGGLVITTTRMNRVLELDTRNFRVRVQPGIINFELSEYLKLHGYHFAPDPSSQKACSVGGNIGMNSGGPHCVKYGVTASHIMGLRLITETGEELWTGDGAPDEVGYDLTGVNVGAAGAFGFVTECWLRIMRVPESVRVVLALFEDVVSAATVVSEVIATGLLPSALEMMDRPVITAVEQAYKLGLPEKANAALIIEVDGVDDGLDTLLAEVVALCRARGAIEVRPAKTLEEQTKVWAARKNAFGAMGRIARSYYLVDTVVPRTKLPYVIAQVGVIAKRHNLLVANVFHAGDGNLHPLVLYDKTQGDQDERAHKIAFDVMKLCVEQGGVISGEHGVALEKREYMPDMFNTADLGSMAALHEAFNASGIFNPGKTFPKASPPHELAATRRRALGVAGGPVAVRIGVPGGGSAGSGDANAVIERVVKAGGWV